VITAWLADHRRTVARDRSIGKNNANRETSERMDLDRFRWSAISSAPLPQIVQRQRRQVDESQAADRPRAKNAEVA